jgi:hypothetical protein
VACDFEYFSCERAGAGIVLEAKIVIDISYTQNWWPYQQKERFPFVGVRDSQNGVFVETPRTIGILIVAVPTGCREFRHKW